MALDLSALSAYTDEQKFALITKSVLGAKTIKMLSVQSGIKSASKINIIDTDAVFQAGGTCGFNASGTTTLSQRTLTVGKIKVHEALCPKDLEAKYTQTQLAAGSQYDTLQFAEIYLAKKSAKIQEAMEKAVWQGSLISGDANLNKFDGIILINDASGSNINGNVDAITAVVGITKSNANAILQGVYSMIPTAILDKSDTKIFVGWDTFRKWTMNLTTLNLFHYNANAGVNGELVLPGTNVMVVAVNGLNGTDRIFAFQTSNMYFGTDMENEEDKFELFFAKEADQMRFMVEWKAGVQVAFPDHVVEFTLV